MKKIISILAIVALLLTTMPAFTFAAETSGFSNLGSTLAVNSNGTVDLKLNIASDFNDPKVLINNEKVYDVIKTNETVYDVNASLPDGTAFGSVTVALTGNVNSEPVTISRNVTLVKKIYKDIELKGISYGDVTANTSEFRKEESRFQPTNYVTDEGIYKLSFEFVTTGFEKLTCRFDTASVASCTAISFSDDGLGQADDNYGRNAANFSKSKLTALGFSINEDGTTRNKVAFEFDTRKAIVNGVAQKFPVSLTINDVTVEGDAKFYSTASSGFYQFNIILNAASGTNYDLKAEKIYGVPGATAISAGYANGSSTEYNGGALSSHNLKSLTFTLDNSTSGTASFVDAAGTPVTGAIAQISDSIANVTYSGDLLASGTYKLVIDKDATVLGTALGAYTEIPVVLSAEDGVLLPAKGETVTDAEVTLSAYAEDAEKVVLYINDVMVQEFAADASNIYTKKYTPDTMGKKNVDFYIYRAGGVELANSEFFYNPGVVTSDDAGYSTVSGSRTSVTDGGISCIKFTAGTVELPVTGKWDSGQSKNTPKVVRKFNIKILNDNTRVSFGLAANNANDKRIDENNLTLNGTYNSGKDMFGNDGNGNKTIAGSTTTWQSGVWYEVEHTIDYIERRQIITVGGNPVIDEPIPDKFDDAVVNGKKCILYLYNVSTPSASVPVAEMEIYNFTRTYYNPAPTASVASSVVAEGTDNIAVTLDKAYSALSSDDISIVNENGETIEGAEASVSGTTVTVSGIDSVKAGTKIFVNFKSGLAMPFATGNDPQTWNGTDTIEKASTVEIYVGNADSIYMNSLNVEADGGKINAYTKYVNGSNSAKSANLYIVEYENTDTLKKLATAPVSIGAQKTGLVTGNISGVIPADCKVFLWDSNLKPFFKPVGVSE